MSSTSDIRAGGRFGRACWLERLVVAACLVLCSSMASGQVEGLSEYDAKALYLFNFAKFVDWPPAAFSGPNSPLVVGIFGDDPFGGTIDAMLKGKTANGRELVLRRLRKPQDAATCQIVFVAETDGERTSQLVQAIRGVPTLTVGESADFLARGGMIHLFLERRKVRFDISPVAAEAAGLRISSRLLSLAANQNERRR